MSSGNEMPPELQWAWTDADRRDLLGRFHQGLQRLLTVFDAWPQRTDAKCLAIVQELADHLEAAGTDLDVCASNCHALANTFRSHLDIDGAQPVLPQAAIRLSRALGSPVILTRTTIAQLAGKTLRLEYLEGANAIVEIGGEYWGTPLNRVLVVQPAPALKPGAPVAKPTAAPTPAFTFRLHRLELSNAIQFLTMTAHTGILSLASTSGTGEGRLVFVMGRVVHTTYSDHAGVEALARMMNLESSTAAFTDDESASTLPRSLNLATDQLLIEAAVRADELTA